MIDKPFYVAFDREPGLSERDKSQDVIGCDSEDQAREFANWLETNCGDVHISILEIV